MKGAENGHTASEDIIESDLELDDSDVVKPDDDPPQKVVNVDEFDLVSYCYTSVPFS